MAVIGGRKAFEEETKKENTLSVLLKVKVIQKAYRKMDMNSDVVVMYIDQMRPDIPDYKKVGGRFPFSFTTSTDEENLRKLIERYIKGNIR